MNQVVTTQGGKRSVQDVSPQTQDFVTMFIDNQMFGLPVLTVQDVISTQKITRIPLAPKEVAGSLNLRGRIVTAIGVRLRLGLPPSPNRETNMSVVVEIGGELYSLMVDSVGEVLSLPAAAFERNPPTLDPLWREFSVGIYRLDGKLLVVLDINRLLDLSKSIDNG
jgi:purine-binding chemotaxis protein CheW